MTVAPWSRHGRSAAAQQAVKAEAAGYSRSGISGVPFFIINGEPASTANAGTAVMLPPPQHTHTTNNNTNTNNANNNNTHTHKILLAGLSIGV